MEKVLTNNRSSVDRRDHGQAIINDSGRYRIALTVAVISWSMLFATLLLGYTVYRFRMPTWPPYQGEGFSLLLPVFSSIFVFASSICLECSKKMLVTSQLSAYRMLLVVAVVAGSCFFFTQTAFWAELTRVGLYAESGLYASILHGFTWIHAGHMAVAMMGIIFLMFRAFQKKFKEGFNNQAESSSSSFMYKSKELLHAWVSFWHFLGIVWIIMFVVLFII